ncbi:hypothetical protein ACRALDRAFT_2028557 [Sodiomyces alcalophilus JCM 7366]|uniref:uncharacterized protein n=1 Tax=Sodiomyces alcalophilus JCM 7366 TaxID=591952 RepID=UPI0039B6321B
MAVDVEELILTPFREVVARGHDAASHAAAAQSDHPDLARRIDKASQAVIREGERALKRVQPQWDAHVAKYGDAFKEIIRENDRIAEKRRILEELLYDFEDFIDTDSFDPDKFAELQAATKSFALSTLDTIRRLKIDPSPSFSQSGFVDSMPPSPNSFPSSLPPLPISRRTSMTRNRTYSTDTYTSRPGAGPGSSTADHPVVPSLPDDVHILSQFPHPPISRPGTAGRSAPETSHSHAGLGLVPGSLRAASATTSAGQRVSHLHRTTTTTASMPNFSKPPPLPPPQAPLPTPPPLRSQPSPGPSTLGGVPPGSASPDALHDHFDRVRITSDPPHVESFLATPSTNTASPRTTAWVSDQSATAEPPPPQQPNRAYPVRTSSSTRPVRGHSMPTSHRPTMTATADSPTLHDRVFQVRSTSYQPSAQTSTPHNNPDPLTIRASSGSFYDEPSATSPTTTNRGSLFSDHTSASTSSAVSHAGVPGDKDPASFNGGLTTVGEVDDGLMLADEAHSVSDTAATWTLRRPASSVSTVMGRVALGPSRRPDCLIGPNSSFHQLKGFCTGAEAFRRSEHTHGMKKAPSYTRLTGPFHRPVRANQMKYNIFYRVRFMFKSHMLVKSLSEIRYACLFCTQTGHTVREGDATVFLTQEQLLRHLSRHPQPLPEVPGVTVLYGKVGQGHHLEEDYDLHFPDPPAATPMPETSFSTLPTATAVKAHVRKRGEIKPLTDPDGSEDILQFLPGARIVGIEFPAKWGGSWCMGWHDGVRGAFPFKLVEIEPPKPGDVSYNANSSVSVKARWKWSPKLNKDEAPWLPLDKGDTIRSVGWVYQDHWCWSGTNSKGKTGVFPASHIDPASIREVGHSSKPSSVKSIALSSEPSPVDPPPAKQSSGIRGLMGRRAIHKAKDPSLTWEGVAT